MEKKAEGNVSQKTVKVYMFAFMSCIFKHSLMPSDPVSSLLHTQHLQAQMCVCVLA